MKHLLVLIFVYITLSGYGQNINSKPAVDLDGSWIPVKEEMGGKELPSEAFKDQKLVIESGTYTFVAESVDKGVVEYANGRMDIYGKEGVNSGKHFMAVYKLENQHLQICYNLAGDSYPAGFETSSKPLLFLCTFIKSAAK